MTRKAPQDRAFNRAVLEEIRGPVGARIIFFDHQNEVREAVYPSEFATGELQVVRERLEKRGVLKGVVFVSAEALGKGGPRTSIIEYLPDRTFHVVEYTPPTTAWASTEDVESVVEQYQALFSEANGEDDGEENDT